MVNELNEANFERIIASEGISLVLCWAAWCRNCDGFRETYERVAGNIAAHRFSTLNTDAQKKIRSALNILHLPTLLVFRDGLLLLQQSGGFDETQLESIIGQTESLDMDVVRSELTAEASSSAA